MKRRRLVYDILIVLAAGLVGQVLLATDGLRSRPNVHEWLMLGLYVFTVGLAAIVLLAKYYDDFG